MILEFNKTTIRQQQRYFTVADFIENHSFVNPIVDFDNVQMNLIKDISQLKILKDKSQLRA